MNICLVSSNPIGGFKSFVENMTELLLQRNCKITLLFLRRQHTIVIPGVETRIFDVFEHQKSKKFSLITWYLLYRKITERIFWEINPLRNQRKYILRHNNFCAQLSVAYAVEGCKEVIDLSGFDCVISTEELLCNYFLSKKIVAKKKIGYVHPDYKMAHFDSGIDMKYFKFLDKVCAVSNANAKSLSNSLPGIKSKIVGIPNPINVDSIIKKASMRTGCVSRTDGGVNLITVCRLDNRSKALDRLIEVAYKLKNSGDNYFWRIIGDGSYFNEMKALINQYDLGKYVELLGYMDNPLPFVKESDLFVLQSYYEGYPMSVCEALIIGTPTFVTNYPSAKEQIRDGIDGYVVDNDGEAIFNKLHYILNHREELDQIRKNNTENDIGRFNTVDRILEMIKKQ